MSILKTLIILQKIELNSLQILFSKSIMLTRSQTPVKPTRFSKRVSRKVVRLSDEYHKYTSGKYHGWSDTYYRSYNLDRMYDINMDSDDYILGFFS